MKESPSCRNNSKYTTKKARAAISLLQKGESMTIVADKIGIKRVTFYRWAKKYKMFGREFRKIQIQRSRRRGFFFRLMQKKRDHELLNIQ
jgi:transposase-like protein